MMFQVRPQHDRLWVIVDEEDQQVFSGTWRECELWLDASENLARPVHVSGFFKRCWSALFTRTPRTPFHLPVESRQQNQR
ncbi:MAG: hypothetical protein ACKVT0_17515 [Planctomycetaceae bacterium]